MNMHAFISLMFGLLCLGTAVLVLLKARRSYLSLPYCGAAITMACYFFARFALSYLSAGGGLPARGMTVFLAGAFFSVPALLSILLVVPLQKKGLLHCVTFFCVLVGFAGLLCRQNGICPGVSASAPDLVFSLESISGRLFFLNAVFFLPLGLIVTFIQCQRSLLSDLSRRQVKVVMGGAAAATVALALSVPHGFGVDLYPVSALLLGIAFMTMSYAIVRYRSLEIDLFVNKTMQALLFVVPLLVLHIVISGLVLKILGFLPATTFSLFIVISVALLTPYKRCIQSLVDRTVYRGRYDYQKVLRELCQTLTAIVDFEQLLDYMLHIIMQTIDVERIAVFLEDEEQGTFVIKALSGLEEAAQDNVSLGAADPLVMRLRKERAILVRGELRQFEPIDNVERQFSSLAMLIPEVVVPLFFKDHLIGMVVLGGRRSEHIYNDGDIEVLRAFAVEAAKAVEHARLYGEAIVDSATMVYNQNYFLTRLREEIARSKRYGHPISLMFIEIETGDFTEQGQKMLLLKGIGLLLKTKVRNVDIVARYSGERFALILPETAHEKSDSRADLANKHKEDTLIVAERVRTSIEYFKKKYGRQTDVKVSIGIACSNGHDTRLNEDVFIQQAEEAMAAAKKTATKSVVFFEENNEQY